MFPYETTLWYNMLMHVKEIKTNKLRWVNISKPEKAEMNFLKKEFKFHPADIECCLSVSQRPRLEVHKDYLFLTINFPIYHEATHEVRPSEIDVFIGRKFIVTSHQGQLRSLIDLFDLCRRDPKKRKEYLVSSDKLIYEILNRLLLHAFPIIDTLGRDIDRVQKLMFTGNEKKIIRDILTIKRNIVSFRRIMQAHKVIIRRLRAKNSMYCTDVCLDLYFETLVEHTKDIWDLLTNYRDTIDAIHETNESLVSFKLNNIMRLLTTISVIMLPTGLIAGIFGMNAKNMPIIGLVGDFWVLIGIMITIAIVMVGIFSKKKWL
jgi:magnesium transporter